MKKIVLNEMVIKPSNEKSKLYYVRIAVWCVLGIILISSIVFRDNIFSEMSANARWLLVALVLGTFFIRPKNINEPSEMEIQLYDDYFVLYRPKRYYSKRMTRQEYYKVMYNQIESFKFDANRNMVEIVGDFDTVFYKYNSSGVLETTPIQQKFVENGLLYFHTKFIDTEKLIFDIEQNSPIRINKM